VQDLRGKKKILSQVMIGFSKIPGIKVLSGKLHGGYCRKRLVSRERVWKNFFLIRIQLEYKSGSKKYKLSPVIYPSDVYPYGRQTLDVVEEMAELRYKKGKSWFAMDDDLYGRYGFSLNRIKRMINRVSLVFERLVTSQIIPTFPNVAAWICTRVEVKSFENLTFAYRDRMLYGFYGSIHLCRENINFNFSFSFSFRRDLFSP
jgi:hypothetical protein